MLLVGDCGGSGNKVPMLSIVVAALVVLWLEGKWKADNEDNVLLVDDGGGSGKSVSTFRVVVRLN